MITINDLINDGYAHWNEPERLARIGAELESRSRLTQARVFLDRAIALDPMNPEPYATLHLRISVRPEICPSKAKTPWSMASKPPTPTF